MVLVSAASLAVVVVSQTWFARSEAQRLPEELRLRLLELRRADDAAPWPFTTPARPPATLGGDAPVEPSADPPPRPIGLDAARTAEGITTMQWSAWAVGRVQDAQWRGIAWGLAIAAAASVALAWWMARGIARPVEAVALAATDLAAGDLTRRATAFEGSLGASAELRRLTADFNAMAAALERAEAARTAMVADVAHELRTPLAAMLLRLEALGEGLTPLDAAEVGRLLHHGRLLHRLVEDLRTLSLADAGRLDLRRAPVDLGRLADEAIDGLLPLASHAGVALLAAVPSRDRTVFADGDRDRLGQVLVNLLTNAIRATPQDGRVVVRTFAAGTEAGWVVTDEGPGIAPADLPHVFERFRQGACGRRDLRGTSGLGLAIVRTLVEAHDGRVTARTRPEGGAELIVTLPWNAPADGARRVTPSITKAPRPPA